MDPVCQLFDTEQESCLAKLKARPTRPNPPSSENEKSGRSHKYDQMHLEAWIPGSVKNPIGFGRTNQPPTGLNQNFTNQPTGPQPTNQPTNQNQPAKIFFSTNRPKPAFSQNQPFQPTKTNQIFNTKFNFQIPKTIQPFYSPFKLSDFFGVLWRYKFLV